MKPSPLTFRSLIGRTDEHVDAAVPVVREILRPAGDVRAVHAGIADRSVNDLVADQRGFLGRRAGSSGRTRLLLRHAPIATMPGSTAIPTGPGKGVR